MSVALSQILLAQGGTPDINGNITAMTPDETGIFLFLNSCSLIVGVLSFILDLLLLQAQIRCKSWERYDRILSYQLTIANIIISFQNSVKAVWRLAYHEIAGDYRLPWSRFLDMPDSAAATALDLFFAILAIDCAKSLQKFYKSTAGWKIGKFAIVRDSTFVWITAIACAVVGMTPRGDAGVWNYLLMRLIAYLAFMSILAYTFLKLRNAKRLSAKLQVDFAKRQAQQNLNARFRLRYKERFTTTMLWLVQWHLILSISAWTADFTFDTLLKSHDFFIFQTYSNYIDNMMTIVLNNVEMVFSLIYPILYCSKHPQTKAFMVNFKKATIAQAKAKANTTSSGKIKIGQHQIGQGKNEGQAHFVVLNGLWDKQPQKK